jgi:hypothetical protein
VSILRVILLLFRSLFQPDACRTLTSGVTTPNPRARKFATSPCVRIDATIPVMAWCDTFH